MSRYKKEKRLGKRARSATDLEKETRPKRTDTRKNEKAKKEHAEQNPEKTEKKDDNEMRRRRKKGPWKGSLLLGFEVRQRSGDQLRARGVEEQNRFCSILARWVHLLCAFDFTFVLYKSTSLSSSSVSHLLTFGRLLPAIISHRNRAASLVCCVVEVCDAGFWRRLLHLVFLHMFQ